MEPPSFSESGVAEALPGYSGTTTRRLIEHRYILGKTSKPWVTLILYSKASKPDDVPYFFGHAPIIGRVELDLPKPEHFVGLSIRIEGGITNVSMTMPQSTGSKGTDLNIKFTEVTHELWKASPNQSISLADRMRKREGEPLEGRRTFEFSIELPHFFKAKLGADGTVSEYSLPSSFAETAARAGIHYNFNLIVQRGSMSKNDQISRSFLWQPVVQPPAMSPARRSAYANGSAEVPAILDDPDGWITLDPYNISGKFFGQRAVQAQYTLSLSKPLCYTRGSIIPLSILFECDDEQAFVLLSNPASISVKLLCNMHYKSESKMQAKYTQAPQGPVQESLHAEFRVAQTAVWWKPRTNIEKLAPGTIRLMGEVHVDPTLKAEFKLPKCKLFYTVTLCAPVVAGFEVSPKLAKGGDVKRLPLVSQEVEIATVFGEDGIRPIPMTPPTYGKGEPWPSIGLITQLEAGFL